MRITKAMVERAAKALAELERRDADWEPPEWDHLLTTHRDLLREDARAVLSAALTEDGAE